MPTPGAAAAIHQDEILTGEAVALDVQPVGFILRAAGAAIDFVVSVVVLIGLGWMLTWMANEGVMPYEAFGPVILSLLIFVVVVVPTAVETVTRGRSLGRLAVGARIVRNDGGSAGFRHAFIRALAGVLEIWMTFGGLAAIVAAFTPRAQRLGDLLAGTYAERTRVQRLPDPPSGIPPMMAEWATVADVARLPDRMSRRVAQFLRGAAKLDPAARERIGRSLAAEVAPFVAPVPAVDPFTFLWSVAAVRRERESRQLSLQGERTAQLTASSRAAPRGLPER